MVFKFRFRFRSGTQALILFSLLLFLNTGSVYANQSASELLRTAEVLYARGEYFKSARYAFSASQTDKRVEAQANALITLSLIESRLIHSATYFFIQTLQSKNKAQIQKVLVHTEKLLHHVGGDFLRPYLVQYTRELDYDNKNRNAYLYSQGKHHLLQGNARAAIDFFTRMARGSSLWPYALQMRGTSYALLGQNDAAILDFSDCSKNSSQIMERFYGPSSTLKQKWDLQQKRLSEDLKARCQAGMGRTYYQMKQFEKSDRAYSQIDKSTFVWTDILFEHAWALFSQDQYNRALGKLVTYKNPNLSFVFNSEVEVLRAHSYYMLCLYGDVKKEIDLFEKKYEGIGREIKAFVESNAENMGAYYTRGRDVLRKKLHQGTLSDKVFNRFVRSSYFQTLVESEGDLMTELNAIDHFASSQERVSKNNTKGFPGFLKMVLRWRLRSLQQLGGIYVKNSLIDFHEVLISDFEKMSFIKIEMLRQARERLMEIEPETSDRTRGEVNASRKDNEYWWSFNGEFWVDELGDYVFSLKSRCHEK